MEPESSSLHSQAPVTYQIAHTTYLNIRITDQVKTEESPQMLEYGSLLLILLVPTTF
jgi:hypothetical protein